MRVLVTGGFGDVGKSVLAELVSAGHTVRCLDVRNAATLLTAARLHGRGIEVVWGDVRCADDMARAVADQEVVIHLAAVIPPRSEINPDSARAVNVDGTRNLLRAMEASATRPRLIHVSSLAVFGRSGERPPPRKATDAVRPFDHYTEHKVEGERLVRSSGVAWAILRLGAVVPIGWVGKDPRLMMREMFEVPLAQRIECVHARDVALALTNAVTCDRVLGRTLLIGGGSTCQVHVRELVTRGLDAMGVGALPDEAFSTTPYHTDWLDTSESQRLLDYQRHSFDDFVREIPRTFGPWRAVIRLARPLLRWLILRQSPYLDKHRGNLHPRGTPLGHDG